MKWFKRGFWMAIGWHSGLYIGDTVVSIALHLEKKYFPGIYDKAARYEQILNPSQDFKPKKKNPIGFNTERVA